MKRDLQRASASTGGPFVPTPPADLPEWLNEVRLTVENETPLMQVFMMRAINAVLRFTELSEDSIVDAAKLLRVSHIDGAPVVGKNGEMVGIISRTGAVVVD